MFDHALLEAGAGADVPHALVASGGPDTGSALVSLSTFSWCCANSVFSSGAGSLAAGFAAGGKLPSPSEDHVSVTLGVAHPADATSSLVAGTWSGKGPCEGGAFVRCCRCRCR